MVNEAEYITNKINRTKALKGTVYVCGNGGSSAVAEHFTNDLFTCGVRAACPSSNTSIVTMIANDFGYEYIFSKQLELFYGPNDLLILFSVSGTSKNILEALKVVPDAIKVFGDTKDYGVSEDYFAELAHEVCRKLKDANN